MKWQHLDEREDKSNVVSEDVVVNALCGMKGDGLYDLQETNRDGGVVVINIRSDKEIALQSKDLAKLMFNCSNSKAAL